MIRLRFLALFVGSAAGLAAAPAAAATHRVVRGDDLWDIAARYYRDPFRWKAVYAANRAMIEDPNLIYPGQILEIPGLPPPQIGELPARPVEKETAPTQPEREGAAVAPVVPAAAAASPKQSVLADDLSVRLPADQAGQYPSERRIEVGARWRADGELSGIGGDRLMASKGDMVLSALRRGGVGDIFEVYRRSAPRELDADRKARYLDLIGRVQAEAKLGSSRFRLRVLDCVDGLEPGDLLELEARQ
ncbi:MAG: LysM peptidoglycan-binding domain-containing protein [Elusimicrobia bacterium]|nr:LysM peptidoglycan-binding domain-containing protein [Elusimicrobiota bacterium]MDE2236936.1 LysM peptidoglycan-binding domain-containing protein [Elusimicrobiota bacterium]MDE2426497.1 LysM peptidoglycan-binding domain-containing protein [Elusimicrobiota bacterium]